MLNSTFYCNTFTFYLYLKKKSFFSTILKNKKKDIFNIQKNWLNNFSIVFFLKNISSNNLFGETFLNKKKRHDRLFLYKSIVWCLYFENPLCFTSYNLVSYYSKYNKLYRKNSLFINYILIRLVLKKTRKFNFRYLLLSNNLKLYLYNFSINNLLIYSSFCLNNKVHFISHLISYYNFLINFFFSNIKLCNLKITFFYSLKKNIVLNKKYVPFFFFKSFISFLFDSYFFNYKIFVRKLFINYIFNDQKKNKLFSVKIFPILSLTVSDFILHKKVFLLVMKFSLKILLKGKSLKNIPQFFIKFSWESNLFDFVVSFLKNKDKHFIFYFYDFLHKIFYNYIKTFNNSISYSQISFIKSTKIAELKWLPFYKSFSFMFFSKTIPLKNYTYFTFFFRKFVSYINSFYKRSKSLNNLLKFLYKFKLNNLNTKASFLFFSDGFFDLWPKVQLGHKMVGSSSSKRSIVVPKLLIASRRLPKSLFLYLRAVRLRSDRKLINKMFNEYLDLLNYKGNTIKFFNDIYKNSLINLQFSQSLIRNLSFEFNIRALPTNVKTVRNKVRLRSDFQFI